MPERSRCTSSDSTGTFTARRSTLTSSPGCVRPGNSPESRRWSNKCAPTWPPRNESYRGWSEMTDLRERVQAVLKSEVAPALELDANGIELLDIDRGCARVRLSGACAGCPATVMFVVRG